ncbi:MAG: LysR family transcriptional regulator [Lautropia sp.]
MNLRTFDLNLLLVFDAVLAERSISRAAQRLSLSQPTVSNALARLRTRLNDPLFTRSAGQMLPTARARALAEPIRVALDAIERGLRTPDAFAFETSEREFVIAVEDYGETVILPRFVDWVSAVAPNVRIKIRPEPAARLVNEMREGAVDLALDYFVLRDARFSSLRVLDEALLTLSRRDHPAIGERLSLETYLGLRHVALIPRTGAVPMIERALAVRGLERRIAVQVPHFMSMPALVQGSDMLCTLPRRMARYYAEHFALRAHPLPLPVPQFPVYLVWHEAAGGDPGHRWFRENLADFCQRL